MDVRGDEIDGADMGKRESKGERCEEVYKGERERERQPERQRERETARERERQKERDEEEVTF